MNLSDTVATFQADCELAHEFVKGDKTVIVNGTAGSYPSLAKIAADSQLAISGLITEYQQQLALSTGTVTNLLQEYEEQLDVSQAALVSSSEALTGLFHLASGIVGKTFHFDSTMELSIKHDMGTRIFSETIISVSGDRIYAPVTIIDNTEFKVKFTDFEAGTISVIFHLNT